MCILFTQPKRNLTTVEQKRYAKFQIYLILLRQFSDKGQIGTSQILGHPSVDATIQFGTEMILPVASFAFADELNVRFCVVKGNAVLSNVFQIDGFVFLETGDFQMLR